MTNLATMPPTHVAYAGLQERGASLRDNTVLGSMSNSNSSNGIISISVAHASTTTLKVVHSGANEPPRRRKIRERKRRIETLFQRFNGGTVSIDEYLDSFKYHTRL